MKKSLDLINKKRIGLTILLAIMLAIMITKPAGAGAEFQLEVTYTNGANISGPLCFGLSTLPASVTATFTLGPGQEVTPEPGSSDPPGILFINQDVDSASITFGDATWTKDDLLTFSMFFNISTGGIDSLFYESKQIARDGGVILNFPLTITGTTASGEMCEYKYTESTQTLTELALPVAIDIKPGSDPNCFNINGHGVIPVAILGSGDFDVSQINQESLSFGGLEVRVRGNKGPLCSIEYSNDDMYVDLVCHFEDDTDNWNNGYDEATLSGKMIDGTAIEGTDSICIVP